MDKKEMDKQRASTLYAGEVLKVKYTGDAVNFHKGKVIDAVPRYAKKSGLPYPQPKWIVCEYYITDSEGDSFLVATDRYGELYPGFEWVRENNLEE